ncbi:MAG: efflux RND transporter permease subunit [Acidobacteria bacterium]|nr:efflux RND transporter permease subunit [Acidobacteriota bacterium]
MNLILSALRRPVTVIVVMVGIVLGSGLAISRMSVDIFPNLNLPVIYVAQPYGGMDPAQMESYLVSYYEYHFLYVTGIEHVESRSIQNVGLVKLFFHPGTDMNQALAQVVSYVERSRAFMPPGTVAPFVVRYDAGSVPVGQLVFSSETRNLGEIQDLALFRVRPYFSTLPGVSAPPPFGGNQRTVVVRVDPDKLRQYQLAPEEVIKAVAAGNTILPAGNIRTGDLNRLAPINSVVSNIQELAALPIRSASGPTIYVRDIGVVENGTDILTGYGLFNEKRTVYIPVTKRADASTIDVVNRVRAELPKMQALIPEDIRVSFELDQSTYVRHSVRGLLTEGLLGALLTGLAVLLFLRDGRSALIVVLTIPLAILTAVIGLWLTGQTINIMTLGGLALAIGILVDESTVAIENIHVHLAGGEPIRRAVLNATRETITPRLLAMLSILAVFVPSFLMIGVSRALFVPLSLAVGLAMLASYLLSNTLVPVLSIRLLKDTTIHLESSRPESSGPESSGSEGSRHESSWMEGIRERYRRVLRWLNGSRRLLIVGYLVATGALLALFGRPLGPVGVDIFPSGEQAESGMMQVRLRAATGTRVERTEVLALTALRAIREEAGPGNVEVTLGYVGTQPASYPVNTIHLWTNGPQEAVLSVRLRGRSGLTLADLKERLRQKLPPLVPGASLSFEAGDIVSQVMNYGSPTPIEVALSGPNLGANRAFAEKVLAELLKVPTLRDLQYGQPLDYPTVNINIDRERAAQLGLSVEQIGRSLVAATSSSRFTQPVYWRDPASGTAYQVQVEVPQSRITSIEDVLTMPVGSGDGRNAPLAGEVAQLSYGTMPGEIDRYNQQRMVTIIGNIAGSDLGRVLGEVDSAIRRAGDPPRGVTVAVRGQAPALRQMLSSLGLGLLLAIGAILLLLAGYFQSVRLAICALAAVPAVISGVALTLFLTGTTLNLQSFMGGIMAIGVSSANAILLVSFAETARRRGRGALEAGFDGAVGRLRPILMTTLAMIAGMAPMALGLGEGGEQTAPLGRAVIGGLAASTIAVLLVVPFIFGALQRRAAVASPSLLEDTDPINPDRGNTI